MTLLVLGHGQLGQAMEAAAEDWGWPLVVLGHDRLDIADESAVRAAIAEYKPGAVVNAAAYTAVDRAESEPDLAQAVNGDAPGYVARAAAEANAIMVHVSTDYVFDGTKDGAYVEDDPVNPLGVYGRTKLAGEQAVLAAGGRPLVLRTAWVFAATGHNFVRTMLRLGRERGQVAVVDDQIGCPTPAAELAESIFTMLDHARLPSFDKWGVYHLAGQPPVSWFEFAKAIFEAADMKVEVSPTDTASFGAPAPRPARSRLDCGKAERVFDLSGVDWRAGLARALRDMT